MSVEIMNFVNGRSCPTGYRYSPESIGEQIPRVVGVLYVIGGLYGNRFALDTIEQLVAKEAMPVTLCFNGDFNWFNRDPVSFESLNRRVLKYDALRGNVETELASATHRADCGCAYPGFVEDQVVERSNEIITALKSVAERFPVITESLQSLAMTTRYAVGETEIAVIHGDPESLAGWSLAREVIEREVTHQRLASWFGLVASDIIACTHTCLPYLHRHDQHSLVINNGSAGMPNFDQTAYGVITRIGETPAPDQSDRLYGSMVRDVHVDALGVAFDTQQWLAEFTEQWDEESPAHQSYWTRINGQVTFCRKPYTQALVETESVTLAN